MMILQEGAKCTLLHLMEKGINQLEIQWEKKNLCAKNANSQFVKNIQLPNVNRVLDDDDDDDDDDDELFL